MKGFTKIALILALVLVVLGSTFCMIGLGIGFSFQEFWENVEHGEFSIGSVDHIPFVKVGNWRDDGGDWNSAETEDYKFAWQGKKQKDSIKKLDLNVYYGTVIFEENTGNEEEIQVKVEYRKKNHRRNVEVVKDGSTLKIQETGSRKSVLNDSARITVRIPDNIKQQNQVLQELNLEQDAGDIFIDVPLTSEVININVKAGECEASEKLTALKSIWVEVGGGQIDLDDVSASEISLKANAGQIDTEMLDADAIFIECGVGAIDAEVAGREQDYDYDVTCSMGDVEIGDNSYSGFSSKRKIENGGGKVMKVDCGVGQVEVSFEK